MTLLCVAARCKPLIGEHQPGCVDPRCRGCLPCPAQDGLQVCRVCRFRLSDCLGELPRVYEDLLMPTKVGGSRGKSSERPQTLVDDALNARTAIRVNLVGWCLLLKEDLGVALPADTVPAMARHLRAHASRLLAGEHAQRLADEVDELWAEGRRRAYPGGPLGHQIGLCPLSDPCGPWFACGGCVRAVVDTLTGDGWATCQQCGISAVIGWWREWMPLDRPEWLGLVDLRWHLSVIHSQIVPEGTIKSWSHPRSEDEPPKLATRIIAGRLHYHAPTAVLLARSRRPRAA